MKSRRLTETDLANMAFKPYAAKRLRLGSLAKPKPIVGSYEPFRRHNGDALNEQYPLLREERTVTSLEMLEAVVSKACKGDADLLAMNIPIARSTHRYAVENQIEARREDVRLLTFPFGHAYEFGMPMLITYADGRMVTVFPDLRRKQPLTAVGRRFVFSAMHHRWRENYPDFSEIGLEAWRYLDNDIRVIRAIPCTEQDLISYDAIIADARETYEIWHDVLHDEGERRRGGGDGGDDLGPLFAKR
jgi:hypothetical protein